MSELVRNVNFLGSTQRKQSVLTSPPGDPDAGETLQYTFPINCFGLLVEVEDRVPVYPSAVLYYLFYLACRGSEIF